jgi:hypothetical protein
MVPVPSRRWGCNGHCLEFRAETSPGDHIMYRLAFCLVLIASTLGLPRLVAAEVTDFYDTVDFAEVDKRNCSNFGCNPTLTVRGILAGGSTPVTRTYVFGNNGNGTEGLDTAQHCQRLAVIAMSKPGKFQFAVGPSGTASGCRLSVVGP